MLDNLVVWCPGVKFSVFDSVFTQAKRLYPDVVVHNKFWRDNDQDTPKMWKGSVLLAMGGGPIEHLRKVGALPKKNTIEYMRGSVHKFGVYPLLCTYSPGLTEVDDSKQPEISWDVTLAHRLVETGSIKPTIGTYKYVKDFSGVIAEINARAGRVPVALDLETVGLDPYLKPEWDHPGARIVSVQITVTPGTASVYYVPLAGPSKKVIRQLAKIVSVKKVLLCGANLKFDENWLWVHWGIRVLNLTYDTFLMGSLLNENLGNSLKLHAKMHTPLGGYEDDLEDKYDKARMDLVPKKDLLVYAGGDTDATVRVAKTMRTLLGKDRRLEYFYNNLVLPAAKVFTKLEHRGVVVDVKRYDSLEAEVSARIASTTKQILDLMPMRLKRKHGSKLDTLKPSLLKDYFFSAYGLNLKPRVVTEKTQQPSTAADHLEMFADEPKAQEMVKLLSQYNSATKTLSTFILGFRKHLRSDGMFHPSYILGHSDFGGTVTGRSSCKDPPWQVTPKHTEWAKPLRTVYVPPPGYAIIKADFAQGELKLAACVANETTMLKAYRTGMDLHLITGCEMAGVPLKQGLEMIKSKDPAVQDRIASIRQGGKAGNFGLIYGMSAEGLVVYAFNTYGVTLALKDAQVFRDRFLNKLYPGLSQWHTRYKRMAHQQGFIRSPLGRIRHLPLINSFASEVRAQAERQSINSPIQATLSDICMYLMVELDQRYPDLWMFGFTHDEFQAYVPVDEIDLWAGRFREAAAELDLPQFGFTPQIPLTVDVEASALNLSLCKKLSLPA